jgi:hypothetical protein
MSEPIPKRARAEQQARKDQGIAVDYPLQSLKRAMQVLLQGRKCHIDDGCYAVFDFEEALLLVL